MSLLIAILTKLRI